MRFLGNTVRIRPFLHFEPRDLWIGVYWTRADEAVFFKSLRIYVCVVPLLPFGVVIEWHDAGWDEEEVCYCGSYAREHSIGCGCPGFKAQPSRAPGDAKGRVGGGS